MNPVYDKSVVGLACVSPVSDAGMGQPRGWCFALGYSMAELCSSQATCARMNPPCLPCSHEKTLCGRRHGVKPLGCLHTSACCMAGVCLSQALGKWSYPMSSASPSGRLPHPAAWDPTHLSGALPGQIWPEASGSSCSIAGGEVALHGC